MVETAIIMGLIGAAAFLSLVAWRLKIGAESAVRREKDDQAIMLRLGELFMWCTAALMTDVVLFTVFEIGSALSYAPALRVVFIIFQLLLGLVASLGMIVLSMLLLFVLFSWLFKGKRPKRK